jgi:hypothetical protein
VSVSGGVVNQLISIFQNRLLTKETKCVHRLWMYVAASRKDVIVPRGLIADNGIRESTSRPKGEGLWRT